MLKDITFAIKAELHKYGGSKLFLFPSPAQERLPTGDANNSVEVSFPFLSPHHVLNEGG